MLTEQQAYKVYIVFFMNKHGRYQLYDWYFHEENADNKLRLLEKNIKSLFITKHILTVDYKLHAVEKVKEYINELNISTRDL